MFVQFTMVLSVFVGTPPEVPPATLHAYSLVRATAIPILPEELQAFFSVQWATAQERRQHNHVADVVDAKNQFILLDIAASGPQRSARRAATRRFPRSNREADEVLHQQNSTSTGRLPWALLQSYKRLKHSMNEGDAQSIARESCTLVELATLAAIPFQTTRFCDAKSSAFTVELESSGHRITCAEQRQYFFGFLERHLTRLRHEARVAPQRYHLVNDPGKEIFRVVRESNDMLDSTSDAFFIDDSVLLSAATDDPQKKAGSILAQWDRRLAPIVEARMEEAALLAANLIGTAWHEAERPDPVAWLEQTPSPLARDTQSGGANAAYVASRNSKIFHRSQCSHARRIKAANLVRIKDASTALHDGRRPCQACNPSPHP